ncbi:MAG: GNAT family N-acetyltransferase [Gemmatimonadaceae bacterium]
MPQVEVTRTYLQMLTPSELRRATVHDPRIRIERATDCTVSFYRYLYLEVGRNHHWRDRLVWTDDEVRRHLSRPDIAVWVMYSTGTPAGWFELQRSDDRSVEIMYFGLIPEFIGRGLGKYMLSEAAERAWSWSGSEGAGRVWLHTCTLDGPAALPNYRKRGFTPYKEERYTTILPD